ncbi:Stage III sporulation protein AH [Paenibacillus plantiphilus]|uniref:Stage III sporulation protein AH n=1 Tax=Paenibacillus plantiphilus TaxID=2905650 RepID=A0ABM9CEX5_9BACL|nr:SpoIIIAH-like family protein [Paenibacillus plantiphilus]CAH1210254.1 Stage III sporulation protein AH [Paenibacillus plantiphilus]
MNTKRQTIWLVSMLSLMVILSAYYLFTEDVDPTNDMLTEANQEEKLQMSATEAATDNTDKLDGLTVTEVEESVAEEAAANAATGKTLEAAPDIASSEKADQEVLRKLEAAGTKGSMFDELQYNRDQKFAEENNRLYSIISDASQDAKEATKAAEQINQLEDKSSKKTGIEEELTKQFSNAIVVEENNNKYKVVVESEKLERSQADSIVMMVMKELAVSADQVSVQFIAP